MKILIASWGDFSRWEDVTYRLRNDGFEYGLPSKTTLSILCEAIKPDITIIFLPDTLGKDFSSLESLYDDLKKKARNFINNLGLGCDVIIEIIPGIGTFSQGSFIGEALDAYYLALYKLYKILPNDRDLQVYFDITHGLNYVTFLVYRALRDLLEIIAMRSKVHLKVYSSDPFIKGIKSLTIHVIEDVDIIPQPLSKPLSMSNKYLKNRGLPENDFGNICNGLKCLKILRKIRRDLNAWIGSIIFGLPLVFASFYPDIKCLENTIEELVNTYLNRIEVRNDNGKYCVVRRLSFGDDFGKLIKILLMAKITEDLPHGKVLSGEELSRIADELFKEGNVKYFVRSEISKILRLTQSSKIKTVSQWTKIRDILKSQEHQVSDQVEVRNFFAHAGLESNVTEVKISSDIYLRYTLDKVKYGGGYKDAVEVIKDIVEKGFTQQ